MSTPDSNPAHLPPVPAYGEYAPHTPGLYPAQPPANQPIPYGQAQYGQPQYGQHPYYQPQYGEKRPVRVADTIISVILLVLGLIGTLFAVGTAAELGSGMQGAYDSYGLGPYEPTSGYVMTQAVLIASHLLLLAISTPLTIVLLVKRKVSFWLPLTAGVIAAIVYWVALMALMLSDPLIIDYLGSVSG